MGDSDLITDMDVLILCYNAVLIIEQLIWSLFTFVFR